MRDGYSAKLKERSGVCFGGISLLAFGEASEDATVVLLRIKLRTDALRLWSFTGGYGRIMTII